MSALPLKSPQKFTAAVMLRLAPDVMDRLATEANRRGLKAAMLARMAIVEYLDRAPNLAVATPEEAELLAELRALRLDPAPHLRALIADASTGAR